jgi:hypothetical protein
MDLRLEKNIKDNIRKIEFVKEKVELQNRTFPHSFMERKPKFQNNLRAVTISNFGEHLYTYQSQRSLESVAIKVEQELLENTLRERKGNLLVIRTKPLACYKPGELSPFIEYYKV